MGLVRAAALLLKMVARGVPETGVDWVTGLPVRVGANSGSEERWGNVVDERMFGRDTQCLRPHGGACDGSEVENEAEAGKWGVDRR